MNKNYLTNFLIILFFVFIMVIGLTNYNSQDNILLGDVTNTPGDVNNDGKISSKDYIMIKKHILKTTTLTNDETTRADINNDGKVSTSDYIMIKKVILGLLPKPTPKVTPKPVVTNTPTPITTPKPTVTSTPTPTIKPTVTPTVTPKPVATVTPIPKPSKIHFLNTDESDAILIESNGEYGLMDASWPDNTYVTKYLDKLGVKKLKYVIISHSDMDHIGGVPTLSKYLDSNTTYYYRSVHVATNDEFYNRAISTMNKANVKKVDVLNKNNINFTIGDFKIELMNTAGLSSDETTDNDNKNSIVAYVTYKGKYGTLLTGDMESQDEYRMASVISSKTVDVLKVAHHSWQSSTTMKFVKAIRPKIAIVTNTQILEDISTPVYYMQQVYKTKFYLTGKSDDAVVIDYVNNLSVTPTKAISETYKVVNKSNQWRQLQNGIWFYIKSGTDLNTIAHNEWVYYNNKWYYLGIQGNMMIGFVETKYTDNGKTKVGVFYLDRDGAMLTGWQQPTEYGPYDKSNLASIFHATYVYSHENYLIKNCYEYTGAWADGKKWFYFDPTLGYMLHNESRVINGKSYTFDRNGICISDGC